MKRTTKAQRKRIVEVLCAADGRTPRWLAEEKRRKQRDRRIRQVEVLRLRSGLPAGSATAASERRRRPAPIDLTPLLAAHERAHDRRAAQAIAQFLVPRWNRIR